MSQTDKESQRWFEQAEFDLADAKYLLSGNRYNTACFMAQQAAEKSVSAYLYDQDVEDVWGNSLADLCEDAGMFDQTFQVLRFSAALLDKYFYLTRYPRYLPGGIPSQCFDQEEAERAVKLASSVIEFVRERLN